ncbi:MAG: hypothetical protein US83_C0010G0098 [Candidatus Falkowbacteria bacterium GW2011_GWC2_38_22]|uniref:Uncharacterized protein n=1 Tax=Candidatus Falkowbacteria bacterium GW2011_GWE1_38_31 TaxID=1618638 RepID=A0A0G0JRL5_9BACT|nr:MAG: hypothetical protein US73_C0005G0098 [Candidatus Falkowbacteria bacterium GW2011_GWF2_38_1205]KKQ61062.1 MAG: hypothetical protein US83_C0010G0098 [Candidatus Falkowbacteria bacterium GW2011_GWC2_38_22]KKQ63409.1 MAG: hypothetical protein US84_C0006G0010 [Candidatus Falkowbacteria bacterium GW2011_GWF1_38_22]KKQ65520.1 MAG: hypothetical protein US87_C0007G0098 [Candidatus Falkowbacteria bacterium GW2011_GWE2_38_254]KKQ70173.1 MAG: hypothetical protein US91_C0006G0010 [Candidatus Falkowb
MNDISEKLFGKTKDIVYHAEGGYIPDVSFLKCSLEGKQSVAHIFCVGCGTYLEANKKQAESLAKLAGTEVPENFDEYYFEVAGCEVCDGDRDIVALKKK